MNLQARVTGILTRPSTEWPLIAADPSDVPTLYREYIGVLAAIPAVCLLLGLSLIGVPFLGRIGVTTALVAAIMTYVTALASAYIAALVVEKLAPTFQSTGNIAQALKLVAHAYTPVWVAGVLYLFVALAPLAVLAAAYAIYLFYLGLSPVMKTPPDKVVPYMIVSALVVIVVNIVLRLLMSAIGGVPSYARF